MTVDTLHSYWQALCERHGIGERHIQEFWSEIVRAYSAKARHYHTLDHIAYLLGLLEAENGLTIKDELAFSIFYHDIVYYVLHSNNEAKSADLAKRRLRKFDLTDESIGLIRRAIMATKGHQKQAEEEVNLFLDFDISILGADEERYDRYCQRVRFEYAVIPEKIFKKGRERVLQYFLHKDDIFHTSACRDKWEAPARANLERELIQLRK